MAKGGFVGGFMGNKWVRISIYSVLVLLIVWVLYLLGKKFMMMILAQTPADQKEDDVNAIDDENNQYPDTDLTDAEAQAIAEAAEAAFNPNIIGGTVCDTLFSQIDPYRDDPNALRKIYKAYGVNGDGNTLFQEYIDELATNCTIGFPYLYPCDVPLDCYNRNESELSCMRWYWSNSGLPGL